MVKIVNTLYAQQISKFFTYNQAYIYYVQCIYNTMQNSFHIECAVTLIMIPFFSGEFVISFYRANMLSIIASIQANPLYVCILFGKKVFRIPSSMIIICPCWVWCEKKYEILNSEPKRDTEKMLVWMTTDRRPMVRVAWGFSWFFSSSEGNLVWILNFIHMSHKTRWRA